MPTLGFWARLLGLFSDERTVRPETEPAEVDELVDPDDLEHDAFDPEHAVELPITDILDLHSFRPAEIKHVVRDYLDAAYDLGLRELRIIHGRGIGVQRKTVHTLLERDPRVVDYADAPPDGGGWGATIVRMK